MNQESVFPPWEQEEALEHHQALHATLCQKLDDPRLFRQPGRKLVQFWPSRAHKPHSNADALFHKCNCNPLHQGFEKLGDRKEKFVDRVFRNDQAILVWEHTVLFICLYHNEMRK